MILTYEWGIKKWSCVCVCVCVCDGMEVRLAISRGQQRQMEGTIGGAYLCFWFWWWWKLPALLCDGLDSEVCAGEGLASLGGDW